MVRGNGRHLYSRGFVVRYPEGDISQERHPLNHIGSEGDRLHIVIEGETLTYLAYKYYRDPLKWFVIADVNKVDNPFILEMGRELVIPNIENYRL